tara:strand:- start:107 stop:1234 length:1128 start_codon:yes stop_codon:yes gene_type:complete
MSRQSDKDIIFKGIDGGAGFTALTLDMSNAGFATFNNGITLKNDLYINNADGSATAGYLYNDSDNFIVRSWSQDKDIIFKGNDGGSTITALTFDMSEAGAATFNKKIILSGSTGATNGVTALEIFASASGAYNTFGSMQSSGATMIGRGVEPKADAQGYVASITANTTRAAIEVGANTIIFKGSAAVNTTRGDAVTMTDRMTIENNGNVTIEDGNLVVASGHGVDFAAANTGASTNSVLDDYEEGTYVPTISTGSGTVTLAGGVNTLSYIKVGGKVTIQGRVRVGATSSPSGTITMTLPFQNKNGTEDSDYANLSLLLYGVDYPTGTIPFAEIAANNSFSTFLVQSDNAAWATFSAAGLSANDIIYVTGTYFTAA